MASSSQTYLQYLDDNSEIDADLEDDNESLASLETDDGQDHPPEKILAEITSKNGFVWYLVKWQDCPILRSSWESVALDSFPWILEEWEREKQRQREGKSKPLDIADFNKRVLDVEVAERQRRIVRRLKRKVKRLLDIAAA